MGDQIQEIACVIIIPQGKILFHAHEILVLLKYTDHKVSQSPYIGAKEQHIGAAASPHGAERPVQSGGPTAATHLRTYPCIIHKLQVCMSICSNCQLPIDFCWLFCP